MKEDKTVPQLRFPEFTDAWKQRELKEVVNFSRGQGLPWADVDDLNGQFECILYGNLYTDYGTIIQNIKHKTNTDLKVKSKGNEVLIPGSDTTPTGLARALFLEKENVILGGDINILSVKHDDGPFLAYELNKLKKELIIRIKGTTVKHLQNNDLKDIVVSLPSLEEQRKISSLFSRLDNTITLQQRKFNSLQKLKKGLLQKMFPKKGENIPEIRFPEFSDAWKQRELKEVVNFSRGQGLPWADVDDLNGQFECILYGNLYTDYGTIIQNIKHKTNTDLKVKSKGNEVLIPGSDTTPTGLARALFLEKENVILGGDINILSVKHDDGPFLAYELNKLKKELIIRIKGTTVKHLQNNDLKDIVVSLPSLEEQRKISSLFSRLDNTITLQQRKLESLQKLKKGLLQQMFI